MQDAVGALARAKKSMTDGRFDARSLEGAQLNALESIAWSLIGLLEAHVDGAEETLSDFAKKAGFVGIRKR